MANFKFVKPETDTFLGIFGSKMVVFQLDKSKPFYDDNILWSAMFLAKVVKNGTGYEIIKNKSSAVDERAAWNVAHTIFLFGEDVGIIETVTVSD